MTLSRWHPSMPLTPEAKSAYSESGRFWGAGRLLGLLLRAESRVPAPEDVLGHWGVTGQKSGLRVTKVHNLTKRTSFQRI
jgi:hypothetical protein